MNKDCDLYVTDFECTDKRQFDVEFFTTYKNAYDCMLKHVKAISNDYGPYIVEKSCRRGGARLVIHFPNSLYVCDENKIEVKWRIYKL